VLVMPAVHSRSPACSDGLPPNLMLRQLHNLIVLTGSLILQKYSFCDEVAERAAGACCMCLQNVSRCLQTLPAMPVPALGCALPVAQYSLHPPPKVPE
jgi:hypothetical protein